MLVAHVGGSGRLWTWRPKAFAWCCVHPIETWLACVRLYPTQHTLNILYCSRTLKSPPNKRILSATSSLSRHFSLDVWFDRDFDSLITPPPTQPAKARFVTNSGSVRKEVHNRWKLYDRISITRWIDHDFFNYVRTNRNPTKGSVHDQNLWILIPCDACDVRYRLTKASFSTTNFVQTGSPKIW
jgi:hypothetical protein